MNEHTDPAPATLQELVVEYCACNGSVRSSHTKSLYQMVVRRYEEFLGRPGTLADFTDKQLVAFVRNRIDTVNEYATSNSVRYRRPLSPYSVEREGNKLLSLWRWAARKGWLSEPTVKFTKRAPRVPVAWSRDEIDRLIESCAKYPGLIFNISGAIYFSALVMMLYDTGERIGPLQEVLWSDMDLTKRFVTFRAETRKGRGGQCDNVQKLSSRTVHVLEQLRAQKKPSCAAEEVFGRADRGTWYYHFKQILTMAGLASDRRSMFHKIRRTHATHLYIAGGDPTQSLGHASDAMTRRYYLDPTQANKGFAADLLKDSVWRRMTKFVRRVRAALLGGAI